MTILWSILSKPRIFNAIFGKIFHKINFNIYEKLKYKIEYITRKELIDLNHLKQSVFDGNIYILKVF